MVAKQHWGILFITEANQSIYYIFLKIGNIYIHIHTYIAKIKVFYFIKSLVSVASVSCILYTLKIWFVLI